jgi:hypothetical protein
MEENKVEAPIEAPVESVEVKEVEPNSLSPREALAHAISESKAEVKAERAEVPTAKEVKAAVDIDPDPPAEFSAKGKDAWKNKDIRGIQEEYKRVNADARREMTRAQEAERAALGKTKTAEDLVNNVQTYLKLRGEDGPTEAQIAEAVKLVAEFRKHKGNPALLKKELQAIGIDLDAPPAAAEVESEKITTLQERLERLERDKEAQVYERVAQTFSAVYQNLVSQKNRTGDPVFPDLLDNSEKGMQFGRDLGSVTQDQRFQAQVLRRFPEADLSVFVREAYKYLGGRVADDSATVSKNNPQHIQKARRAAASSPGKTVSTEGSSALMGKLSNRAALKKAIELSKEH